ncbi:hypothetical protein [Pontitalea aquivivens]|uniref:hypothetical protein n=1 Tax=Pontitalea aquivivens TaxID=3388663 RepID=UPI0039707535
MTMTEHDSLSGKGQGSDRPRRLPGLTIAVPTWRLLGIGRAPAIRADDRQVTREQIRELFSAELSNGPEPAASTGVWSRMGRPRG